jgi:hypothetical protein
MISKAMRSAELKDHTQNTLNLATKIVRGGARLKPNYSGRVRQWVPLASRNAYSVNMDTGDVTTDEGKPTSGRSIGSTTIILGSG